MAGDDDPKEFPDVSTKLSAPKKLSTFERDRLAAEEKKRREQAENEAALKEFEDSFADDGNNDDFDGFPRFPSAPSGPRGAGMGFGGPQGRFGGPGGLPRSGPGSLGPPPAMQPPNLRKRRAIEEARELQAAKRDYDDFTADYVGRGKGHEDRASNEQDDDEEDQDSSPRPTVQLSSLPPSYTEEDVKALLTGLLPVHSVQLQPPPDGPFSTGRKSLAAIVQISSGTQTPEIDKAVSTLKDKYLGCGFKLSISRHLSSTALQPNMPALVSASSAEPFGGEKVNHDQPGKFSMRNAPPPSSFAPPGSYDASAPPVSPANATVTVQPPVGMNTIRAVHTIADKLLSEPDAGRVLELEAMLMALPEIQNDERFSFLYDSRSPAGVYYRYLLWTDNALETVQARKGSAEGAERIHSDVFIDWLPPYGEAPFADLSSLGDMLDHDNYPSNDESDYDEDEERLDNGETREKPSESTELTRLTPLQVAKFSWMLSKMPTAHANLDKGRVAATTSFAIKNARVGAEEIVNMMVMNVEKPYTNTLCGKNEKQETGPGEDDEYEPDDELPPVESTPLPDDRVDKREVDDPSQVKVVALWLINDILHSCATASAKNAWKYRQLFENAFKQHQTFRHLGRLPKELGWGKIRADRWRNTINALFDIWGRANIFAVDAFNHLKQEFFQQFVEESGEAGLRDEAKKPEQKLMSRFKRVDGGTSSPAGSASPAPAPPTRSESLAAETSELEGEPMGDDLDGEPMEDDLDGEPMDDDLADYTPMTDAPKENGASEPSTAASKPAGFSIKTSNGYQAPAPEPPKRRKLAEDMFADSDED